MPRALPALVLDVTDLCPDGPVGVCAELVRTCRCGEGSCIIYWDRVEHGRAHIIALGECSVETLLSRLSELGVTVEGVDEAVEYARRLVDEAVKGRGERDVVKAQGDRVCLDVYRGRSRVWGCCTTLDNILLVYRVVTEYCKGGCRSREVAEHAAREAGLDQFFEGGVFDWQRFQGDRETYHQLLYCPLRILRVAGLVRYEGKRVEPARVLPEDEVRRVILGGGGA